MRIRPALALPLAALLAACSSGGGSSGPAPLDDAANDALGFVPGDVRCFQSIRSATDTLGRPNERLDFTDARLFPTQPETLIWASAERDGPITIMFERVDGGCRATML